MQVEGVNISLTPLSPSSLPLEQRLDVNPAVTAYLYGRPRTQAEILETHAHRLALTGDESTPWGYWVATVKATGEEVGLFMLLPPKRPGGDAELGYRLLPEFWGRGYAVEGATMVLDYAFGCEGIEKVYAEAMARNKGSWRVMEKLGMRFVRNF